MASTGPSSTELRESSTPVRLFSAACARWATGVGSAADLAAVAAFSTTTPLPLPHDPAALGFDIDTRRPPPPLLDAFFSAKDRSRADEHAAKGAVAKRALNLALFCQSQSRRPPPYTAVAELMRTTPELAKMPAAVGLSRAAAAGTGRESCAVAWIVQRQEFEAVGEAGARLAAAMVADSWNVGPHGDDGDTLLAVADARCRDLDLALLVRTISLASLRDGGRGGTVLPAGEPVESDVPRAEGTKAPLYMRAWWQLRLAVEGRFASTCLGRRTRAHHRDQDLSIESVKKRRRLV